MSQGLTGQPYRHRFTGMRKKNGAQQRARPGKSPSLFIEVTTGFMVALEHYCADNRLSKKEAVLKAIRSLPGMSDYLKKEGES